MKRILSLCILLAPTAAFADGTMDSFHRDLAAIGDARTTCVDFNGTWTGTCDVVEASSSISTQLRATRELSMTFVQHGCATIQAIDFGLVQIGATRTESSASPRGSTSTTSASFWMDDGRLGMVENMNLVKFEGKGVVYEAKSNGEFGITDGVLTGKITNSIVQRDMNAATTVNSEEVQNCRLTQARID